jgi:hypothetical protein
VFIRVRNGEAALKLLLARTLLGGDEIVEAGQELRLRERLTVLEVELLAGAPEALCHHIVGVRRLLDGVQRAEGEASAAIADLRIEGAAWAGAHADATGRVASGVHGGGAVSAAVVRVAGERARGVRDISAAVDDASRTPFYTARKSAGQISLACGLFSVSVGANYFDASSLNWRFLPRGRLLAHLLEML